MQILVKNPQKAQPERTNVQLAASERVSHAIYSAHQSEASVPKPTVKSNLTSHLGLNVGAVCVSSARTDLCRRPDLEGFSLLDQGFTATLLRVIRTGMF